MIYLTDFKKQYEDEIEKKIRDKRPDLVEALENGDSIVVAEFLKPEEFRIA